jgi:hypothetical protein
MSLKKNAKEPNRKQNETVVMKSSVFWDDTTCSFLKVNRLFGGTCGLHLQARSITQARNRSGSCCKQSSGFLLGLFFYPEYWGETFF